MQTNTDPAGRPAAPPPRHKMALLTWGGAWAMITLILKVLGPLIATWALPLQTLLISALMVLALTWVVIPTLTKVFAGWLAPTQRAAEHRDRDRAAGHRPSLASAA